MSTANGIHGAAATLPQGLEPPDEAERAHLESMTARLHAAMDEAGGVLEFSRWMELALYAPGLGYYASSMSRLGPAGDFTTAPELGDAFGICLARQCAEVLERLGGGVVLEAGAGSGRLAASVLGALDQIDCLPERYLILELSPALAARQRETLMARVPVLMDRVEWIGTFPQQGVRGVIVANELLDAIPCSRFRVGSDGVSVLGVTRDAGSGFAWCELEPEAHLARLLAQRIAPLGLPLCYESEIVPVAEAWVRSAGDALVAGAMVLVDYGFPRSEFYHPQRATGTLMCHRRHRAHADPLVLPGLQDITAHVEFTAIAEAGHDAGLDVAGFTAQASFLIALGVADGVNADGADPATHLAMANEIKRLTLPSEMGELFKVIAFTRSLPGGPLRGFTMNDARRRL